MINNTHKIPIFMNLRLYFHLARVHTEIVQRRNRNFFRFEDNASCLHFSKYLM